MTEGDGPFQRRLKLERRESTVTSKATNIFFLVILLGTMFPAEAFAYLDPGTGSLLIQGVIATLAAVAYGLRLYWSRIQFWFKRPGDRADSESVSPPTGTV